MIGDRSARKLALKINIVSIRMPISEIENYCSKILTRQLSLNMYGGTVRIGGCLTMSG